MLPLGTIFGPNLSVGFPSNTNPSSCALNAAYVHGTSGPAALIRFVARESTTLTNLYFYVSGISGTLANIQFTVELRAASGVTIGGSVVASATCGSNGVNTWSLATFSSPPSVTAGSVYHLVIRNSSAAPTVDIPSVTYAMPGLTNIVDFEGMQTNNGSTSFFTINAGVAVLKFGSGAVWGNPYSAKPNYPSTTRERGVAIAALSTPLILNGIQSPVLVAAVSGAKIIKSTTAPGTTPGAGEAASAWINTTITSLGLSFTLSSSQAYRVVLTFSSATSAPDCWQIGDYARYADVQSAALWGGMIYSTIDNGSGGWTDEVDKFPAMALLFNNLPTASGGGGLVYLSGMNGGLIS